MRPLLTICCPSLLCRMQDSTLIRQVHEQSHATDGAAEFVVLADDMQIPLGTKMQQLYTFARGQYVCSVADDDTVSDDYVDALLHAVGKGPDVVTFDVDWGAGDKVVVHPSPSTCDFRPMAVVRTEIAQEFDWPPWWRSEDTAFKSWLRGRIRRQHKREHVKRVLYHYDFRVRKPEFGMQTYAPRKQA